LDVWLDSKQFNILQQVREQGVSRARAATALNDDYLLTYVMLANGAYTFASVSCDARRTDSCQLSFLPRHAGVRDPQLRVAHRARVTPSMLRRANSGVYRLNLMHAGQPRIRAVMEQQYGSALKHALHRYIYRCRGKAALKALEGIEQPICSQ
jgi:hypothetical protein